MSKQTDRITSKLSALGMAWATSPSKHIHPDDPMQDQIDQRKTWHVHPDASNPQASDVKRFDTLDELEEWIDERTISSIAVEFSNDALFGSGDTEGIDVPASIKRFAESLTNHLHVDYPTTEISVIHGINDRIKVNGQTDHIQVDAIQLVMDRVWNGDDWMEYN